MRNIKNNTREKKTNEKESGEREVFILKRERIPRTRSLLDRKKELPGKIKANP